MAELNTHYYVGSEERSEALIWCEFWATSTFNSLKVALESFRNQISNFLKMYQRMKDKEPDWGVFIETLKDYCYNKAQVLTMLEKHHQKMEELRINVEIYRYDQFIKSQIHVISLLLSSLNSDNIKYTLEQIIETINLILLNF